MEFLVKFYGFSIGSEFLFLFISLFVLNFDCLIVLKFKHISVKFQFVCDFFAAWI